MRGVTAVLVLLVIAFSIFVGWYSNQRRDYFPASLRTAVSTCEVTPGVFERRAAQFDFEDEWFSGELSAFDEPSLFDRSDRVPRSIRLTWLRSFHPAVVVRVDATEAGTLRLTAKQRSTGAGYRWTGGIEQDRELVRDLTPAEAIAFEGVLEDSDLFDSPPSGCTTGLDGARWIIEGSDPGRGYRYRSRQSPRDGLERSLGLHLLALTGWNNEPIY